MGCVDGCTCALVLKMFICMQSQVKGESESHAVVPVHVYGPEGVGDFLDVVLATSDTCLYVPVVVFEFVPGPVEDGFSEMECLNQRSKLFRVRFSQLLVHHCSVRCMFTLHRPRVLHVRETCILAPQYE